MGIEKGEGGQDLEDISKEGHWEAAKELSKLGIGERRVLLLSAR